MNAFTKTLNLLEEVNVRVSVELGSVNLPLREVLGFALDSVVALDRLTDEPLDVLVNGTPIARAEVITQDRRFALRIVELVAPRGQDGGVPAPGPALAPEPAERTRPAAKPQKEA